MPAVFKQPIALELSAFSVRGEPIPYEEAVRGRFAPIQIGEAWGPPWSTTWFHVRGRVPDGHAGKAVMAVFDLGFDGPTGFTCEALAWKDSRWPCGGGSSVTQPGYHCTGVPPSSAAQNPASRCGSGVSSTISRIQPIT